MPLGESLAVTNIAESDYGRARLWGSLTFMAANIIGGRKLGSGGGALLIMPILNSSSRAPFLSLRPPWPFPAELHQITPMTATPMMPNHQAGMKP